MHAIEDRGLIAQRGLRGRCAFCARTKKSQSHEMSHVRSVTRSVTRVDSLSNRQESLATRGRNARARPVAKSRDSSVAVFYPPAQHNRLLRRTFRYTEENQSMMRDNARRLHRFAFPTSFRLNIPGKELASASCTVNSATWNYNVSIKTVSRGLVGGDTLRERSCGSGQHGNLISNF